MMLISRRFPRNVLICPRRAFALLLPLLVAAVRTEQTHDYFHASICTPLKKKEKKKRQKDHLTWHLQRLRVTNSHVGFAFARHFSESNPPCFSTVRSRRPQVWATMAQVSNYNLLRRDRGSSNGSTGCMETYWKNARRNKERYEETVRNAILQYFRDEHLIVAQILKMDPLAFGSLLIFKGCKGCINYDSSPYSITKIPRSVN